MSFIDAYLDGGQNRVHVVERDKNGSRIYKEYPAEYVYYTEDRNGTYKTMWGDRCIEHRFNNRQKFKGSHKADLELGKKIHEDSVNPIFRCLYDNYRNKPTANLNIGFFDIEVDFDPDRGFAPPSDPFARITAISVYLTSGSMLVTLVLKPDLPIDDPDYLSDEAAAEICAKFENTILCKTEKELLQAFIELIDDCDIISGWNSTGFDIPYTVNRITRILGTSYIKKLCLWNQTPKKRKYLRFGKEQTTYDLVGRVHFDYLELYQKHYPQKLHTYKLDYVGEITVKENKIPYEGTLDNLYKRDFEKFIAYNRQDTLLLHKIDQKCRFIELHNQLAHTNSVLLQTTLGSVAMIDQAIINSVWQKGFQVPARKPRESDTNYKQEEEGDFEYNEPISSFSDDDDEDEIDNGKAAVGAYVADPIPGLYKMIGCVDINSLYPSVIRALNMGPETIVGQIRPTYTEVFIHDRIKAGAKAADAWHEVFCALEFDIVNEKREEEIIVDFEDGTVIEISGKDFYEFIYGDDSEYILSANGTIFKKDVPSAIAELLAEWYAGRKQQQRHKSVHLDSIGEGYELSEELLGELM